MDEQLINTHTPLETQQVARKLGYLLRPNDVVTLTGDLGAGKTTFTKGLGEGLGVKRTINSPTFTIVKSYQGEIPFHHIDAYRLEESHEDIGFDEYFTDGGVTVVEWPQYIEHFLPEERLNIEIKKGQDDHRQIILRPVGRMFKHITKELFR
ncbi:tRNA threonylcarbamoyladenosine biosynthesis protein TsaE [Pelagirhabdus alkalitolerans]|uniref:tRNA threonylcarbamoyladenosine biosynthesis protein TsaE n=1 Tax=Pelagirhabdus alkalitolerans TaxID=1612202 RepID=A0A1G6J4B5_9BACI|nr:tRNA (adenosine(37)-N6)-threonylcarbamoyltransferase complex ATPase subunit type 1 TsaE [Pelagirhabdus alkalitolerans]SDC13105.1 tRNA threonylcarbamoyladenosine biosynthesis protein TsaE [Pelagirhabdus alkalitolerans]